MKPNVILIVLDTARADRFEPFGAPTGVTPAVAQLVTAGATTRRVMATSNWTLPSHASLFTGLLPRSLGLGGTTPAREVLDASADRLAAVVMARAGWATGAISTNPWITRVHGFGSGFDAFVEIHQRRHAPGEGRRAKLRWLADAVRADLDDGLSSVEAVVEQWLTTRARDEPFFWFVNLMECHSPYLPPQPYNDLGLLGRLRAGMDAYEYQSHRGLVLSCIGELEIPRGAEDRMRHLYSQSIRSMDDWLARLLDRLEREGVLDETLLIVTSDHGENLGESGMLGHGFSLDDRLIRVPLIASGPGAEAFEDVESLADVPSALAQAVHLEEHPWEERERPGGLLVAEVDGLSAFDAEATRRLIERWRIPQRAVELMLDPLTCAVDGRFKLVRQGSAESLYDLDADPLETTDVAPLHGGEVVRLRAALDAATPPPGGVGAEPTERDAALEQRLRLLGYL